MTATTPFFSIVIANYNHGRFLPQALASVLAQDCQDFELIVVDGGSVDDSVEVIQGYAKKLGGIRFSEEGSGEVLKCGSSKVLNSDERISTTKNTKGTENVQHSTFNVEHRINNLKTLEPSNSRTRFLWCSEKDRGQSHAFNKGFQKASGRFLTWLNADDLLFPGTLRKAKAKLVSHPECQWLTGNFVRFLQDGTIMECKWGPHILPGFVQKPNSPVIVYGPTAFFGKTLYEEAGRIDESLHLIMDTDLWLRFMSMGVKQRRLNHCCWGFRMHEESKTAFFPGMKVEKDISAGLRDENHRMYTRHSYRRSQVLRLAQLLLRGLDGSALVYLWRQSFLKGTRLLLLQTLEDPKQ